MAGRGTSLGPLLIISAIDLLLCCLTAAVMLFLIFQPSQRADRSSALFQGSAGVNSAQHAAAGNGQAPAIVIVHSTGETGLIQAGGSSDYQVISSASSKTTIFRSPGAAAPLRLVPADADRRFIAHIAVTKDGKLFSANKSCAGSSGAEVLIDPFDDPPITLKCPKGAECIPEGEANQPGDWHLVLISKDDTTPTYVPMNQCYRLIKGDSFERTRANLKKCELRNSISDQEFVASAEEYNCLWGSFYDDANQDCNQVGNDRIGFWQETVNQTGSDLGCPVPEDEAGEAE